MLTDERRVINADDLKRLVGELERQYQPAVRWKPVVGVTLEQIEALDELAEDSGDEWEE